MFAQTCDADLENLVETSQSEPFIAVLSKVGLKGTQYFICAEKAFVTESKTLKDALLDLMCFYYIFNIIIISQDHISCIPFYSAYCL